jgi:hypothetical protein
MEQANAHTADMRWICDCQFIRFTGHKTLVTQLWIGSPERGRLVTVEVFQSLRVKSSRQTGESLAGNSRQERLPGLWGYRFAVLIEGFQNKDEVAVNESGRHSMAHVIGTHLGSHFSNPACMLQAHGKLEAGAKHFELALGKKTVVAKRARVAIFAAMTGRHVPHRSCRRHVT